MQEQYSNSFSKQFREDQEEFLNIAIKKWKFHKNFKRNLIIFSLIGVFLLVFAIVFLIYNLEIVEVQQYYGNCALGQVCSIQISVPSQMSSTIYVYYQLDSFYRRNRNFFQARSVEQLRGSTNPDLSGCSNYMTNAQMQQTHSVNGAALNQSAIAFPCGEIAYTYFNDSFQLYAQNGQRITIVETSIAWQSDIDNNFVNPPNWESFAWTNITNEHFMVWMRTAGQGKLKKLWGKINEPLPSGTYTLNITNNYVTDSPKSFFMTTTTVFGRVLLCGSVHLPLFDCCVACHILSGQEKKNHMNLLIDNEFNYYNKASFTKRKTGYKSLVAESLDIPTSPSYVSAMKALQERVKGLESENASLRQQISQIGQRTLRTSFRQERQVASPIRSDVSQNKHYENLIAQINQNHEDLIERLKQGYEQRIQQMDHRSIELANEIENQVAQNERITESNETYKKKISELTQSLAKEKHVMRDINQTNQTITLQLENVTQSYKETSEKNIKYRADNEEYRSRLHQLENYLDWYTRMYTIDAFKEMELKIKTLLEEKKTLSDDCQALKKEMDAQRQQFQFDLKEIHLQDMALKLHDSIKQQSRIQKKPLYLDSKEQQTSTIFVNTMPSSTKKQNDKQQQQEQQTNAEDFSILFERMKTRQSYENFQQQEYATQQDSKLEQQRNQQLIQLQKQIRDLDHQYDMIVRQAQSENDIKLKQLLRTQLIELLTQIKYLNAQIQQLQQKQ